MTGGDLVSAAEELLEHYRGVLLVDPFYRIKVELVEGDFISKCEIDEGSALTWILKLNAARHDELSDVQYSVVECLVRVLFYTLDVAAAEAKADAKEGLVSRLATAITGLSSVEEPAEEENDDEGNP